MAGNLDILPPQEHEVCLSGFFTPATCGLRERMIDRFSDDGQHHVYVVAWVNGKQSRCAHVVFDQQNPNNMAGSFALSLNIRDQDPDAVKLQFCMRMPDPETGNRRTAELYTTYTDMNTLLTGAEDRLKVVNQFTSENRADVVVTMSNAKDFRNHASNAQDMSKPLLRLSRTNLRLLHQVNQDAIAVSHSMRKTLNRNKLAMSPGGNPFEDGMTRYSPPSAALFVALFLGTPAYSLLSV